MGFKYHYVDNPEGELRFRVLAEGEAEFMVRSITETDDRGYALLDKNGNPKFIAEYIVKDSKKEKGLIEETFSGSEIASWKIKELLESLGMGQEYNQSGELDLQRLVNRRGRMVIYTNKYTKSNGGEGANSRVREYIAQPQKVAHGAPVPAPRPAPVYTPPVQSHADDLDYLPF